MEIVIRMMNSELGFNFFLCHSFLYTIAFLIVAEQYYLCLYHESEKLIK